MPLTTPKQLTEIDDLTRRDHFYLEASDECYYVCEYTARGGYGCSETNQQILNLKTGLEHCGAARFRYKGVVINEWGRVLSELLPFPAIRTSTWVPVPPSKCKEDPLYDDRLVRVLQRMGAADIREMVLQIKSKDPGHLDPDNRESPENLIANYRIDEALLRPKPERIIVFDDVLTTGAHFKAIQSLLNQRYRDIPLCGIFLARVDHGAKTVFEDFDDIEF